MGNRVEKVVNLLLVLSPLGFLMCCVLSCVWLSATRWTVTGQAPLSMRFPREDSRSGVAIASSRGSFWTSDRIHVSWIGGQILYHRATTVLEKTPDSPLDCKEIRLVNPKGNKPQIFIARTDAEAEALILQPPDPKSWLLGKDCDVGKDWRQKEKGWHKMRGHTIINSIVINLSKLWGIVEDRGTWWAAVHVVAELDMT